MAIYRGLSGVNREIKKQHRGFSSINREIKEQYCGVSGTNRKVFQSRSDGILYWLGDERVALTGGYILVNNEYDGTFTRQPEYLSMKTNTTDNNTIAIATINLIDFNGFNLLNFEASHNRKLESSRVLIRSSRGVYTPGTEYLSATYREAAARVVYTIDISSINVEAYLIFVAFGYSNAFDIYRAWLE